MRAPDGSQSRMKALCGSLLCAAFHPSVPRVRYGSQEIRLPWSLVNTWVLESNTGLLGCALKNRNYEAHLHPQGKVVSALGAVYTLGAWLSGASKVRIRSTPRAET